MKVFILRTEVIMTYQVVSGFLSLSANYSLRLEDNGYAENFGRVEIRQKDGEWGTICCSSFCTIDEFSVYNTDDICILNGYRGVIGVKNNLETDLENTTGTSPLPVHLSLDNRRSINVPTSIYDLGISEWYKPTCTSAYNLFVSCLSGK